MPNSSANLTFIVPCWGRPQGTRSMILDTLRQTIEGWEALFIGDACPVLDKIFDLPEVIDEIALAESRGNIIKKIQLDRHYGGSGYAGFNKGIEIASNDFLIFGGNDDRIAPNHFENYLYPVRVNDLDFVIFDSIIKGVGKRVGDLQLNKVGHSEIIVRADLARGVPHHLPVYGHDWIFITELVKCTQKIAKDIRGITTYNVMRLKGDPEIG